MLISIVYKTNVSIFDAHTHLSYLVCMITETGYVAKIFHCMLVRDAVIKNVTVFFDNSVDLCV